MFAHVHGCLCNHGVQMIGRCDHHAIDVFFPLEQQAEILILLGFKTGRELLAFG